MTIYTTHNAEAHSEIKRSRFLTFGYCIDSAEQHAILLQQLQQQFHKANHVCWAYRVNGERPLEGYSDDGEPSGTAGMPILNVLRHHQLVDYAVYVVRFFGGIKLGTGGLQRAYSGAAQQLLNDCTLSPVIDTHSCTATLGFAQESFLRREVQQLQGRVVDCHYHSDRVDMTIELPSDQTEALQSLCQPQQILLRFAL
ncbi:hypothetical protein CHH28_14190 [Bacterioplanes sanyensis]|uniref:YigZ family protein n=1 Tax=Bacterioplanes sanyensis TaxID=1249553 RepID=A0A222FN01_9GAMM|nr:YigZ family protein [Bacterioplanes sanyensis]ASP39751.1 hypothetical protein CHH28_14190 [Bacterioplanes sanyensis]